MEAKEKNEGEKAFPNEKIRQSQRLNSSRLIKCIDDVDQSLFCPICSEIAINPQECAECQNIFCEECVLE